jgi:sortase family protein
VRRWFVLGVVGLLIAGLVPLAWSLTRPGDAGEPVAAPVASEGPPVTGSPSTPSLPTAAPSTRPATPRSRPARPAERPAAGRFRLSVPSLGVTAPILPVGVRSDGNMDIPEPVQDVGWYRFGSAPGSSAGSAVLAGHVDSAEQGKGALFGLRSIDVGARIDVTTASGRTVRYRVTGRQSFVKKRLPTERLFTRTGSPRLIIITCGGPFIRSLSSYRDNLVVAAEPVT